MATTTNPGAKDTTFNIRTSQQTLAVIDRAAAVLGKTRTEFVLEASRHEAEDVLLGRIFFAVDDATHARFVEQLDKPAASTGELRKLLQTPAPWE